MEGYLVIAVHIDGSKSYHCAESVTIATAQARDVEHNGDCLAISYTYTATPQETQEYNTLIDAWFAAGCPEE